MPASLQWLREREIIKTRAYSLIQLADSSDALVEGGPLEMGSVNHFSKRAFAEAAQAPPEVQQMISEVANKGQSITRKQVRRLSDDHLAATSLLVPDAVRRRTQENLLAPPGPWPRWFGSSTGFRRPRFRICRAPSKRSRSLSASAR